MILLLAALHAVPKNPHHDPGMTTPVRGRPIHAATVFAQHAAAILPPRANCPLLNRQCRHHKPTKRQRRLQFNRLTRMEEENFLFFLKNDRTLATNGPTPHPHARPSCSTCCARGTPGVQPRRPFILVGQREHRGHADRRQRAGAAASDNCIAGCDAAARYAGAGGRARRPPPSDPGSPAPPQTPVRWTNGRGPP